MHSMSKVVFQTALFAATSLLYFQIDAQPMTAGQKLFEMSDVVSREDEAKSVAGEDAEIISRLRGRREFFREITVLKTLNFGALRGKNITLITPEGMETTFEGESIINPDRARVWSGRQELGDRLTISASSNGFHGEAQIQGKSYLILSLPKGRQYLLVEVTPLSNLDVVLEEPSLTVPPPPAASQPKGR